MSVGHKAAKTNAIFYPIDRTPDLAGVIRFPGSRVSHVNPRRASGDSRVAVGHPCSINYSWFPVRSTLTIKAGVCSRARCMVTAKVPAGAAFFGATKRAIDAFLIRAESTFLALFGAFVSALTTAVGRRECA
ncbi:unnamed protein product [Ixodes pacificus]